MIDKRFDVLIVQLVTLLRAIEDGLARLGVSVSASVANVAPERSGPSTSSATGDMPPALSATTAPASVTGDMAPATMNGEITVAWLARA